MPRRLHLSFAAAESDRLRAIKDGVVSPEGIDLDLLTLPVEEVFYRQLKYREFDVAEMSLSSYVLTLQDPDPPFIAIPAFPSRYFRHQTIFIRGAAGIHSPGDLRGRRVGVPEYEITAAVWQRGILQDDYGVLPEDLRYVTGGVEEAGRPEKLALDLPSRISVEAAPPGRTLSDLLVAGEIDALFTAHVPSVFYENADVLRLFPDYKTTEKEYYARTGIFPIMHVIAIRRVLWERHPWVARSLMKALERSLAVARATLMYRSSLAVMLPWLAHHLEETITAMGDDYWTYGVEPNRVVLETFLRYSHEQGLAKVLYRPEDLFAPGAADRFRI